MAKYISHRTAVIYTRSIILYRTSTSSNCYQILKLANFEVKKILYSSSYQNLAALQIRHHNIIDQCNGISISDLEMTGHRPPQCMMDHTDVD